MNYNPLCIVFNVIFGLLIIVTQTVVENVLGITIFPQSPGNPMAQLFAHSQDENALQHF